MIRVLLAEDQAMVRGALAALLSLEGDIEVVAEVARGDEVVPAALSTHPDVALLDIEMPGGDGLSAAYALRAALPTTWIVPLATLALLSVAPLPLHAQSTAPAPVKDEPVTLDAFVSTGTRFNDRTVVQSPVPIDVISSEDLNQGGFTETSQMLQALVPSFNFPRPSLTDGTDHIRPATLRGLAPDQVLVLVNGKRRHTSALVNVNGSVGRGSTSWCRRSIAPSAWRWSTAPSRARQPSCR